VIAVSREERIVPMEHTSHSRTARSVERCLLTLQEQSSPCIPSRSRRTMLSVRLSASEYMENVAEATKTQLLTLQLRSE
jgi:hypothetical protein